jgi:general secretion pathway protein I
MSKRRLRERGFSLIEVTVAFAIAAISLGVLSNIFGNGSRNLATSRLYIGAVELAETLLAQHSRQAAVLESSTVNSNDDYRWTVTTESYNVALDSNEPAAQLETEGSMALLLVKITVDITWGDPDSPRTISVSTLRPRPALKNEPGR